MKDKDIFNGDAIDDKLISLAGENKKTVGANATLPVSLAIRKVAAAAKGLQLYKYLNPKANTLPIPMFNVLNGGAHAAGSVDLQEFMLMPVGASNFGQGLRMVSEVFQILKKETKVGVGDEGYHCSTPKSGRRGLSAHHLGVPGTQGADRPAVLAIRAAIGRIGTVADPAVKRHVVHLAEFVVGDQPIAIRAIIAVPANRQAVRLRDRPLAGIAGDRYRAGQAPLQQIQGLNDTHHRAAQPYRAVADRIRAGLRGGHRRLSEGLCASLPFIIMFCVVLSRFGMQES
jgi:hypothetical protein